ncbi:MAG: phage Gp37/Gp68 family protein [bacterium]
MATRSKIEWTDITWNPVTGCTKVSPGCMHCYAERMAHRLQAMGQARYKNAFNLTLHYDLIEQPLRWFKPQMVFVNSMSDLFHEEVPFEFIQQIFNIMALCPHHIFQILTKRSERLRDISHLLTWPENVWMGVSIENESTVYRIDDIIQVPSSVRFLSCEPLIGPLDNLPLQGIQWVIVGGESGPGARLMHIEWVESILRQCKKQNVPFFFKQWGGVHKHLTGRILHDRTYDELPGAAYRHPHAPVLFKVA